MFRRRLPMFVSCALLAMLCVSSSAPAQSIRGRLISHLTLRHLGLDRGWATQIAVDGFNDSIKDMSLQSGLLLVRTTNGIVHVLNAETGELLWNKRFGTAWQELMAPAANDKYVAVVHGSMLHVVTRDSGQPYLEKELRGVAGGPPAMSDGYTIEPTVGPPVRKEGWVYVPLMFKGMDAMPLKPDQDLKPWRYASSGEPNARPIVTPNYLIWSTARGDVYTGQRRQLNIHFRFDAGGQLLGGISYKEPYFYAATREGYVWCVNEDSGVVLWRFRPGTPVLQRPLPIGPHVYVVTQIGGMFAISAEIGTEVWWSPGVAKFVAASQQRLYVEGENGRLLILDAATGGRLGQLDLSRHPHKMTNWQNDRIYIANETGLIQCLHEAQFEQPWLHNQPLPEKPAEAPAEGMEPAAEPAPMPMPMPAGNDPFAAPKDNPPANDPFAPGGNAPANDPFAPGGAAPANDPFAPANDAADDDPF